MLIAAVGILLSILGIFCVRTKEDANIKQLLGSLSLGTNLSSVLIVAATFLILWLLGLQNWALISCSVVVGLLVGVIIGRSTEYYTSQSYKPTKKLAESGTTGPATVIISGVGLGMVSTAVPVIAVVAGIILSYWFASGFDFSNVAMGLYGIGSVRLTSQNNELNESVLQLIYLDIFKIFESIKNISGIILYTRWLN